MRNAKKAVLAAVATLALAFIIGATSDGPELGSENNQSSGSTPAEMMQLAGNPEHTNGGG